MNKTTIREWRFIISFSLITVMAGTSRVRSLNKKKKSHVDKDRLVFAFFETAARQSSERTDWIVESEEKDSCACVFYRPLEKTGLSSPSLFLSALSCGKAQS